MVRVADHVKQTEAQVLSAIKGSGLGGHRYKGGYGSGIVGANFTTGGGGKNAAGNVLSQGETLETIDRAAQQGSKQNVSRKSAAARRPY